MDNFIKQLLQNIDIKRLINEGMIPSGVSIPLTAAQKQAARATKTKLGNNEDFEEKDISALAPYVEATIPHIQVIYTKEDAAGTGLTVD